MVGRYIPDRFDPGGDEHPSERLFVLGDEREHVLLDLGGCLAMCALGEPSDLGRRLRATGWRRWHVALGCIHGLGGGGTGEREPAREPEATDDGGGDGHGGQAPVVLPGANRFRECRPGVVCLEFVRLDRVLSRSCS